MASLGFEDTERALKMYFSGRLGDDIPKPKHRDGRIVEFTSKGRRRLEHVTTEDVAYALTCVRAYNERAFRLILDRYKWECSLETMALNNLMSEEAVVNLLGEALKIVAKQAVDQEPISHV